MKVVISGGGTGGHIYPAISIAKKIKSTYSNAEILYIGTENGMESKLVPKEGLKFKTIRVKGFSRKLSKDTFKSMKELFLGLNDAKNVIKEFSPDIVIGTGGYVCGPIVLIAALKKIPTIIHEQNAFPGVTNKILSKFVNRVAASFEESKSRFKNSEKVTITGNPIRQDILKIDKDLAYSKLGIRKELPFILCFGGSGGQKSLNDNMLKFICKNIQNKDIQIIHITGERFYKNFLLQLKKMGIEQLEENIKVVPYFYDMPEALNIADLVVTSGGAITIAELTAVGVPSIIVPKAYTTENHQEYNARALEKVGASIVILEKDLTGDVLMDKINELLNNKEKLKEMSNNSKNIGIVDADERILDIVNELI